MAERIYKTKVECESLGWLDVPTLRAMRLKPAKSQNPASAYWQGRGEVYVYAVAACVPMAAYRAPTPAQLAALAAGRILLSTVKCTSCEQRIDVDERSDLCRDCTHAKRLSERDLSGLPEMPTVYLDTETTGLSASGDEIVEISICNDMGQVIINSLVRPTRHTEWPEAQEIHGISPDDVQNAPSLGELMPAVLDAIKGKRVVIYNSEFHYEFLPKSTFNSSAELRCCMFRFAEVRGEWSDYFCDWRWQTLTAAAEHVGHTWSGNRHRAMPDVLATRSVWQWMQARALPPRPAPEFDDEIPY